MVILPTDFRERFAGIGLRRQPRLVSEIKGSETRPINIRLQDGQKFGRPQITPRQYQLEIFKKALETNTIVYLGTGLGKTFIVVMLLRSPLIDEKIRQGKKAIFLAPTQDLVKQQAEYVYRQVPYKIKVYCGRTCNTGLHIDNWSKAVWDSEFAQNDLLFMTPAILNQRLAVNVINWNSIGLLIFDEVHHAATSKKEKSGEKGGTDYSQILKHFNNMFPTSSQNKPKFLGLTASLINNMPKDAMSIMHGICDLEAKLHANCVTDLSAIETKPKHVIWTYNKPELTADNDTILRLFIQYAKRLEETLETAKADRMALMGPKDDEEKKILAYHNRLKLAASGFSIKPKSLHKVLKQLAAIRVNSGLWTLSNICYNLTTAMDTHAKATCVPDSIRPVYQEFGNILKKVLLAVHNLVGSNFTSILLDYTQPKLLSLLEILRHEHNRMVDKTGPKETFSCIIFVKSRVEVVAICSWLIMVSEHIAGYDFIKANYAIGLSATMASKWSCITKRKSTEQGMMLEDFRKSDLNVIVTTSVLEEGIDLPVCSTVIRYDSADTFRVYVQSRGRARQKESSFIILTDNTKQNEAKDALDKYNDFEERVKEALKEGDRSRWAIRSAQPTREDHCGGDALDGEDVFRGAANEIYMTPTIAKTILHMYCSRLSRRCPYSTGLQFRRQETDNKFQTTLYFPPGCPVKDCVQGFMRGTIELADNSAVIQAFKALYEAGELDSHGVPVRATEEHIDKILSKFNMQPEFLTLNEFLEGEVTDEGPKCCHAYPWKLGNLTIPSLQWRPTNECYKLYRITFKAESSETVRADTLSLFERSAYGIILDASNDIKNFPAKIWSHYGQFLVVYDLIDDNLRIDSQRDHRIYLGYTFRLISTFWTLQNFRKELFAERCFFYLVPLDNSNNVVWARLETAFFIANDDIRPGDVVKINRYHTTKDNFSKRFLVHQVRTDLNARSHIPGCRETFEERLRRSGGKVQNWTQPVVAVIPISREFGKTSVSKRVRSDDTTQLNFYLYQCLERIKCDPNEAYQAYNLPEIVYQVYINALGSELEKQFLSATESMRHDVIVPEETEPVREAHLQANEEAHNEASTSPDDDDSVVSLEEPDQAKRDDVEALEPFALHDLSDSEGEDSDFDFSSQYDSDTDSDLSSNSDGPAPAKRYLDILARQEYNLHEKDKSGLEKWDLGEYEVPDLKKRSVEHKSSCHLPNFPDSSANSSSILSLLNDTLEHQCRIEQVLRNFQKGIMGDMEYLGEDSLYDRSNNVVDLNVKPPITFDRLIKVDESSRCQVFIKAITARRADSENNLEALENVGDSYLKYFISVLLFKFLDHNEGTLTTARSRLVGNKHFYYLAKKNRLGYYGIRNKFDRETLNAALGAQPTIKNRFRTKDLADMFESLVGASLINGGEYEAILTMKWLGLNRIIRNDAFVEFHPHGVVFTKSESPAQQINNNLGAEAREYLNHSTKQVKRFQNIIKYEFNDPSFLVQAFTHASAFTRFCESYERLEFLGDAILDFLVTMTLYNSGITTSPGQLTSSRSALVNNCTFAKLAIKYKFDVFIQHANQQLYDELNRVNENAKTDEDLKFLDIVDYDRIAKTLADVFEAVAGAIYLDSGCSLDTVYSIYYPMMKEHIDAEIREPTKNIIASLYEMFPGKDRVKFEYYKATTSEDEDTIECAKCIIFGYSREFFGEGLNKRQARMRAVMNVMENLPSDAELAKLNEEWAASTQKTSKPRAFENRRGSRGGSRGRSRGRPSFRRF